MASWVWSIALVALALEVADGDAAALGVVILLGSVPSVLSLWGGVLTDRHDPRRLLLAAQIGSAVAGVVTGLLALTDHLVLWHLYLVAPVGGGIHHRRHGGPAGPHRRDRR